MAEEYNEKILFTILTDIKYLGISFIRDPCEPCEANYSTSLEIYLNMNGEMFPEWKNEYRKYCKFFIKLINKFKNKKKSRPFLDKIILKHFEKKITGYQQYY